MKVGTQGFTLIELVVALAVLSLLSLLVLQALNIAHQAWDRGTRAAERLDSVATAQQSLRRAVSSLLPVRDNKQCSGTVQSLAYLSSGPQADHGGGTARYGLAVETRGGGTQLSVSWCPREPESSACDPNKSSKEVLIDGADGASISYFEDGGWQESWANCAKPPQLIRIDVRFTSQDRRVWPPLVIHPRYAVAADCQFDLVSMKCRPS